MPGSPTALSDIPPEIRLSIFSFLPLDSLLSIFLTCREFGSHCDATSPLWTILYESQYLPFQNELLPELHRQDFESLDAFSRLRILARQRSSRHRNCWSGPGPHGGKYVLLGDGGVGKTSIATRYIRNQFFPYGESGTIGSAFVMKSFQPGELLEELQEVYTFELWDTAGQERYKSLSPMYYRGASAAIFVFDLTQRDTFDKVQWWMRNCILFNERRQPEDEKQEESSHPGVPAYVLLGNKCDLIEDHLSNQSAEKSSSARDDYYGHEEPSKLRQVERQEVVQLMLEFGRKGCFGEYFETSAKTGHNVTESMEWLARYVVRGWSADQRMGSGNVPRPAPSSEVTRRNFRSRCFK